jgi:hypothetical protein
MEVSNHVYQAGLNIPNRDAGCAGRDDVVRKFHFFLEMIFAYIFFSMFLPEFEQLRYFCVAHGWLRIVDDQSDLACRRRGLFSL